MAFPVPWGCHCTEMWEMDQGDSMRAGKGAGDTAVNKTKGLLSCGAYILDREGNGT